MQEIVQDLERCLLHEQRILSECVAGRYRAIAQDGSDATPQFMEQLRVNIEGFEQSIRLLSQAEH